MWSNAWCGAMGLGGWVAMAVFWAVFLGLVIWAVTRIFPASPPRREAEQATDRIEGRPDRTTDELAGVRK